MNSPTPASARRHVSRLKGFYRHLLPYLAVMSLLGVINLVVSPHHLWVLWVAGGWGLGLLVHALSALVWAPKFDRQWERRQIQMYLARRT